MTNFFERHAFKILCVVAFLLPFSFMGARRALRSNRNDVAQWLPAQYPETKVYQSFRKLFNNEQFILVSWNACNLDDQRLRMLSEKLAPRRGEADASENSAELFNTITTGPLVLERLTSPPLSLPREEAIARLKGSLIGRDENLTCAVLTLTDRGKKNLKLAVDEVVRVATKECGVPEDELHMGGPPVDNVAIDRAGEKSLVRLAGLSGLVGLSVSWLSLRSRRLVIMVMFTGMISVMGALAVVFFTGTPVNAILLTMPSLVYVSATSGAIHLANYYREAVKQHGPKGAAAHALSHATVPLTLATITTAVGLATLYSSDLVPIQIFGIYSAIGVVLSLLALFLLLPSMLESWPLTKESKSLAFDGGTLFSLPTSVWDALGNWITNRPRLAFGASMLLAAGFAVGLTQIETSVSLMRMFSRNARLVHDYAWLEKNLGELVPLEVMVSFDRSCQLSFLERMRLVERTQSQIAALPEVGSFLSTATFAPLPPEEVKSAAENPLTAIIGGERGVVSAWGKQLERHREEFLKGDYLRDTENGEAWRITARVGALQNTDYGQFVKQLRVQVEPVLDAHRWTATLREKLTRLGRPVSGAHVLVVGEAPIGEEDAATHAELFVQSLEEAGARVDWIVPAESNLSASELAHLDAIVEIGKGSVLPKQTKAAAFQFQPTFVPDRLDTSEGVAASAAPELGIEVVYTGLVPLVYRAQRSLLSGMTAGFILDMALVAVVMSVLVRNLAAGAILFFSALFPAVIIFGLMGWVGIVVDPGAIMTPAVALGVTVDDVVHFMLWYLQGRKQGLSQKQSVLLGYRSTAQAMYQSWGVIGLGLSVFAVSPFMPTQRFGMMMLMLLTAALVGNLVLLPALLMSPLGAMFGRAEKAKTADSQAESAAKANKVNSLESVSLHIHEGPIENELPAPHLRETTNTPTTVRGMASKDANEPSGVPSPHLRVGVSRRETPAFQRRAG